jgi:saccharopine dehydrogenase-like NADP-dependent oxidoreductase
MRFIILGGAGAMGRITVTDLVKTSAPQDEIVIADYDFDQARALAGTFRARRVRALRVDVKDRAAAVKSLNGAFVLINAVQYQLNVEAMELALALKAHYVDLGGLFHGTRRQLALDRRFRDIGRTALLGMGAAPGITNVLARYAADRLDTVSEIHARVGSLDRTRYEPKPALALSYSLKTVLEEFSSRPAVFTKGRFAFLDPMSGAAEHRFPPPVGLRRPMHTLHSEVATLPISFRERGVREVSFKIAFDPEFLDRVRFLRDLGLASHEPIVVPGRSGAVQVAPIDVVNKVAMAQPAARRVGPLRQYEVLRAVVKGSKDGRKLTWVADCHTSGMPAWGIGLDIDTGSPPAIAAQMLARGEITARGALPPESAVPPAAFFKHLARRGMTIKTTRRPGWDFAV